MDDTVLDKHADFHRNRQIGTSCFLKLHNNCLSLQIFKSQSLTSVTARLLKIFATINFWHASTGQSRTCLSFRHQTGTRRWCRILVVSRFRAETRRLCNDHLQISLMYRHLSQITHILITGAKFKQASYLNN